MGNEPALFNFQPEFSRCQQGFQLAAAEQVTAALCNQFQSIIAIFPFAHNAG
jgi:hypothetical protein